MLSSENKNIQSKIYRHMQAITTNNFFWQIKTRCTLQSFVKYHNYNLSIVMTNYKGKQSINLYYMDLRKCVQFCKTYRLPQSLLFSFICTWKSSIKSRFCVFPLLVQRKRAESSDCRFVHHATVFTTTWYRKTFWERYSLHFGHTSFISWLMLFHMS